MARDSMLIDVPDAASLAQSVCAQFPRERHLAALTIWLLAVARQLRVVRLVQLASGAERVRALAWGARRRVRED
jgi:hypothetical protein